MSKCISVFGGNGFLGRAICREAVSRGWKVSAVSRSGKPASGEPWSSEVEWVKGDIFQPKTYESVLKGSDAVVHSVGLIWENQNYKKLVNSESTSNPLQLLGNAFNVFTGGANPMEKQVFNTYDGVNHQSAILLAETLIGAKEVNKFPFVYISADFQAPTPKGYRESKQITELELYELQPKLRPIFMRPGFMFDEREPGNLRHGIKSVIDVVGKLDKTGIVPQTISIQKVARSVLNKLEEDGFAGPVSMSDM